MEWKNAYVLVRPERNGTLNVVHTAEQLKDARYWLQYIAEPGDAIFVTPTNPQYKGKNGEPTFMSYLVSRGKLDHSEPAWKRQAFEAKDAELSFVGGKAETAPSIVIQETQIIQLANGKPHAIPLELLSAILQQFPQKFQIVLAEPSKWIEWESAMTLMMQDMFVVNADPISKWPLTVTLKPDTGKGETMNYEADMRFVIRQRA